VFSQDGNQEKLILLLHLAVVSRVELWILLTDQDIYDV